MFCSWQVALSEREPEVSAAVAYTKEPEYLEELAALFSYVADWQIMCVTSICPEGATRAAGRS